MIEGKTKDGFEFKIDERILDDWRLVETIALAESDDASEQIAGLMDTAKFVLGDRYEDLKKHIAEKNDGFIPRTAMTSALIEIVNTARSLKNSSSSEG